MASRLKSTPRDASAAVKPDGGSASREAAVASDARSQVMAAEALLELARDVYEHDIGGAVGLFGGQEETTTVQDDSAAFERCGFDLACSRPPATLLDRCGISACFQDVCAPQFSRALAALRRLAANGPADDADMCPESGLPRYDWRGRLVSAIIRDGKLLPALFWWVYLGEQLSLRAAALLVRMVHMKGEQGLNWAGAMLAVAQDAFGAGNALQRLSQGIASPDILQFGDDVDDNGDATDGDARRWWALQDSVVEGLLEARERGGCGASSAPRGRQGPGAVLDAVAEGYARAIDVVASIAHDMPSLGFGIRDHGLDWFRFLVTRLIGAMFRNSHAGSISVQEGRSLHPKRLQPRIDAVVTALTTGHVGGSRQWSLHVQAAAGGPSDSVHPPGRAASVAGTTSRLSMMERVASVGRITDSARAGEGRGSSRGPESFRAGGEPEGDPGTTERANSKPSALAAASASGDAGGDTARSAVSFGSSLVGEGPFPRAGNSCVADESARAVRPQDMVQAAARESATHGDAAAEQRSPQPRPLDLGGAAAPKGSGSAQGLRRPAAASVPVMRLTRGLGAGDEAASSRNLAATNEAGLARSELRLAAALGSSGRGAGDTTGRSSEGGSKTATASGEPAAQSWATGPRRAVGPARRSRRLRSKGRGLKRVAINGRLVSRQLVRDLLAGLPFAGVASLLSPAAEEFQLLADLAAARAVQKLEAAAARSPAALRAAGAAASAMATQHKAWDCELNTTKDGSRLATVNVPLPELVRVVVDEWTRQEEAKRAHPELLTLRAVKPRAMGGRTAGLRAPAGGEGEVMLFSESVAQALSIAHRGGSHGGATSLRQAQHLAVQARLTQVMLFGAGGRPISMEEAGLRWSDPETKMRGHAAAKLELGTGPTETGLGADFLRVQFGSVAYDTAARALAPTLPTVDLDRRTGDGDDERLDSRAASADARPANATTSQHLGGRRRSGVSGTLRRAMEARRQPSQSAGTGRAGLGRVGGSMPNLPPRHTQPRIALSEVSDDDLSCSDRPVFLTAPDAEGLERAVAAGVLPAVKSGERRVSFTAAAATGNNGCHPRLAVVVSGISPGRDVDDDDDGLSAASSRTRASTGRGARTGAPTGAAAPLLSDASQALQSGAVPVVPGGGIQVSRVSALGMHAPLLLRRPCASASLSVPGVLPQLVMTQPRSSQAVSRKRQTTGDGGVHATPVPRAHLGHSGGNDLATQSFATVSSAGRWSLPGSSHDRPAVGAAGLLDTSRATTSLGSQVDSQTLLETAYMDLRAVRPGRPGTQAAACTARQAIAVRPLPASELALATDAIAADVAPMGPGLDSLLRSAGLGDSRPGRAGTSGGRRSTRAMPGLCKPSHSRMADSPAAGTLPRGGFAVDSDDDDDDDEEDGAGSPSPQSLGGASGHVAGSSPPLHRDAFGGGPLSSPMRRSLPSHPNRAAVLGRNPQSADARRASVARCSVTTALPGKTRDRPKRGMMATLVAGSRPSSPTISIATSRTGGGGRGGQVGEGGGDPFLSGLYAGAADDDDSDDSRGPGGGAAAASGGMGRPGSSLPRSAGMPPGSRHSLRMSKHSTSRGGSVVSAASTRPSWGSSPDKQHNVVSASRAFIMHLTGITSEQLDQPMRPRRAPEKLWATGGGEDGGDSDAGSSIPTEANRGGAGGQSAGRSQEEKKLVHARVIASLKRGAARTMRAHPSSTALSGVAASDILAQLDPSQRQATHLITAPAALADASKRLADAMNIRFDADQRRTKRIIARGKRQLQADVESLAATCRATLHDPDEMSRISAAYGATIASDYQTMLERNHMAPAGQLDDEAGAVGARDRRKQVGPQDQDSQESKNGEIARMAATRAARAARARPWRANADSLDKARQQSGGRYVPPDLRGEDSALAFTRAERARLQAIEQAGAARAGEALQAVEEVTADKEKEQRLVLQKIRKLRTGDKRKTQAEAEAEDEELAEAAAEARHRDGTGDQIADAPLRDGELIEAASAVARVLASLGVNQQRGTTLDAALTKLERWGVLPSRSGMDERRATLAAPLQIDATSASRALRAAGDLTSNRRVLQRSAANLSMANVLREQRFAEEPQVTDAAATAIGRNMKGGGVPYAVAGREEGLSAGPVAEGRKLGLSLPEILLLARCVKHRQQRRVLDTADETIRTAHAQERAVQSRKRMAAAREALTSARLASQSSLQAKSIHPQLRIGASAVEGSMTDDNIDDLVEAWREREQPEGRASTDKAVAAAVTAITRRTQAVAAAAAAEDGVAASPTRPELEAMIGDEVQMALQDAETAAAVAATGLLDPTSSVARHLRRREDVEGKSLGLATRIELLNAMLREARNATRAAREEKLLPVRLLDPGIVAGVGLDTGEEEEAEAARRQQRRLQRKWQQQAATRKATLHGAAAASGKVGQGSKHSGQGDADGASSDEQDSADKSLKASRVPVAGWEPPVKGRMTVEKARARLLAEQMGRRQAEDTMSGERPKSQSNARRYVEWPNGACGPRGEAVALPEAALDDALEDGRRSMQRARRAVESIREVRRSMPQKMKARLQEVKAELLESGTSHGTTVTGRDPGSSSGRGTTGAPVPSDTSRSVPIPGVHKAWKSDGLLGAGERAALLSLGTVPQPPTGREALRVLADELMGNHHRESVEMQHHEIQLELRALLEERHNAKVSLGEATRLGRGIERVYFSKLITNRSLDEAL